MTDEELGYRRINAGVMLDPNYIRIKDGKTVWNHYFIEGVYDAIGLFNDMFLDKIISRIGDTGWAIHFTPVNEMGHYFADIYVDKDDHFHPIVDIIKTHIPAEFRIEYWYKGNIATYTTSQ